MSFENLIVLYQQKCYKSVMGKFCIFEINHYIVVRCDFYFEIHSKRIIFLMNFQYK